MRNALPFRHAHHLAAVAAGVALLLAPASLHAQAPAVRVVASAASPDLQRAELLETQAAVEERSPKAWRDAASLYRRAAELRGDSPEAAALYQRSAWLYSAAGDHGNGRQQLERAARISLNRGDVVRAANTLFDAALMAATDKDVKATDATLQRLGVLLDAPLMPDDVRGAIKLKLNEPARMARR